MAGLNPTGRVLMPEGVDLPTWAAFLYEQFAGSVPQLSDPLQWKAWACQVVQSTDLSKYDIPSPMLYEDWQPWATDLFAAYRGNL